MEAFFDEIEPEVPFLSSGFHKLADFPALLRAQVIDEVIVAVPRSMLERVASVVAACTEIGVPIASISARRSARSR